MYSCSVLQVYQKIGLKDKERYKRELQEYKEKLMLRKSSEATARVPSVECRREEIPT